MTLLAPLFLLGVLGVALPMWLHRLSSENPNKQQFSSVMLLEPGVLAKRLQYLLLLALRIGVLALLALAFAGPALRNTAPAALDDSASLNVIVMDVSASMRHGQRWTRARDAALDIVSDIQGGNLMQLLAAGRTVRVLVDPTQNAADLRQGLSALNPEYSRVDYGELMNAGRHAPRHRCATELDADAICGLGGAGPDAARNIRCLGPGRAQLGRAKSELVARRGAGRRGSAGLRNGRGRERARARAQWGRSCTAAGVDPA
jgi:hypothetical protein